MAKLGLGFDPTIGGSELTGEFRVLGGETECRTQDALTPDGTKQTLRTCVFTTRYEFRYLRVGLLDPATQEPIVAAEITADITTDYQCNTPDFPEAPSPLALVSGYASRPRSEPDGLRMRFRITRIRSDARSR